MPRFTAMLLRDAEKNETYISRILPTIEEDYHVLDPIWIIDAPDELGASVQAEELLERRDRTWPS